MKNEQEHHPQDELLARYLAGEPGAAGEAKAWIAASAENRAYFETMKRTWEISGKAVPADRFDTDAAWEKMQARIHPGKKAKRNYFRAAAGVLLVAAILFVVVLVVSVRQMLINDPPIPVLALSTGDNTRRDTLPDGSMTSLNRDSRLEYTATFTGETREVSLSGEAFFEVAHNADQPFVVHAGAMDVRVLGTSFNVRAYPGTDSVCVSVRTGKVKCSAANDTVVIGPGEIAVYNLRTRTLRTSAETDPNTLAWRTRTFEFSNTPLSVAVKKLNEVYGEGIVVKNPQIGNCRLTAVFRNESLDNIVTVIGDALGLQVARKGQTFLLDGNGCP
jgi:transmembrane sensor